MEGEGTGKEKERETANGKKSRSSAMQLLGSYGAFLSGVLSLHAF